MKSKVIEILNVELSPDKFPLLYQQAKANPQLLEVTIKNMVAKQYNNDMKAAVSAMIVLEMDLEHDLLANK